MEETAQKQPQLRIRETAIPWLFALSKPAYFLLIHFAAAGSAVKEANALKAPAGISKIKKAAIKRPFFRQLSQLRAASQILNRVFKIQPAA